MSSLSAVVGPGTEIIPAVLVPISGTRGCGLIRNILDFDTWLHGSALGQGIQLEGAGSAFWEVVRDTGAGG